MPRRRKFRAEHPTRPAGGPSRHARADWLGGEQLAAWANQTLVSEEAYAPFGEVYAGTGAGSSGWFTGVDADTAPNLWDFPAREYASVQGRWLSPDPAGLAAVDPANPQTRSAHACVANQPLTATDPLGLMAISVGIGGGPCDMFAGPCDGGFGGPGPCDVTGWNPWPAPGCAGGGLSGGIGVSIVGFGGGGGGGGTVVGTPSGPASGTPSPCTAGICSPANLVGAGGGAGGLRAFLPLSARPLFSFAINVFDAIRQIPPPSAYEVTVIIPKPWIIAAGWALTFAYIPATHEFCYGGGWGLAGAKNLSAGPLWGGNAGGVLSGGSVSVGGQVTWWGGAQSMGNSSGSLAGPTLGIPGASFTITDARCSRPF